MSAYTEADVERLAAVIHDARVGGISYGNYTLARWILDRWTYEETGRRWVFSLDSKPDVVMADGTHRYWSTHCRHGNHDLCKGTCKGCAAMCICGCGCGCDPHAVDGSIPIASPPLAGLNVHTAEVPDDTIIVGDFGEFARAAREGRSVNPKAFAAIKNVAAPAGEVVSVPPPSKIDSWRRQSLTRRAVEYAKEYGHWRLEADAAIRKLDSDEADLNVGCAGDALDSLRRTLGELYELGAASRPEPADEPAPVPPPVDAILKLVAQYGQHTNEEAQGEEDAGYFASGTYRRIEIGVEALYAAGVEEGRRAALSPTDPAAQGLYGQGITDGRRAAGDDIAEFLRQIEPNAIRYAPESSICTRRANVSVLGAYERAAAIARDARHNHHCSNCGDTRGGPFGHETSECNWDRHRIGDALNVPRDDEAAEVVLASARAVAAEAGFGPAPESVTVSYDVDEMVELRRRLAIYGSVCEDLGESGYAKREPADVKGVADAVLDYARQSIADAFARGVAEGRQQASGPVLAEVVAERIRQDLKWGEQNHPDGTGPGVCWGRSIGPGTVRPAEELREYFRDLTDQLARDGEVTWLAIALEEMAEAFAEDDPAKLRTELVQLVAVGVQWIQAIDRRSA